MLIKNSLRNVLFVLTTAGLLSGCHHIHQKHKSDFDPYPPPAPLGTLSDPVWQNQERNAEASDFTIFEHEFKGNSATLNPRGEKHVRQIATRALETPFPIMIQPSTMTVDPDDQYGYPIHRNLELDLKRREVIVHVMRSMGVEDAEERVVVSPALTPGFEGFEAERSYRRGFSGGFSPFSNSGFGGNGGFGGSFGGGFGF